MKLKKELGLKEVFCIATGAMISSGLFVLPGLIYAKVGPAVILAYLLAGLLVVPVLFAKIELSTAMPKAGGDYFFIERSMGATAGTIGGFISWFSLSFKSAFSLLGIGLFATLINPGITDWHVKLIAVGFCVFFTLLNIMSVKSTSRLQCFLVYFLILALVLYCLRGAASLNITHYTPFMPFGRRALLVATAMVFISFGGLTKISSIAEEVRDPVKQIPAGTLMAFIVVLVLYGITIFVTVGLLNGDSFANTTTPLSDGAFAILGKPGAAVMAFAAMLAFVSTANAGILSASRFPLAMSRDQLLPASFGKINRRFNTPHISILATGLFMSVVIIFLDLESLVKVASTMKILLFMMVMVASIIMRESRILNYKPVYKTPLYPWLLIFGLVTYGFFVYEMGRTAIVTTAVFMVGCLLWVFFYVRKRATHHSALINIIERVTNKEIVDDAIRTELREILRERDQIIEDKFDKLVQNARILDIQPSIPLDDFFEKVAVEL
ncbi:amino acid permease, partial [bacterium]|nr:amino acid permease [bacterium]